MILREAGFCTGFYPSPYLQDFRERIQVNGELITDPAATLAEVVGILRGLNEETFTMIFTFDKSGNLLSTAIDMTMAIIKIKERIFYHA